MKKKIDTLLDEVDILIKDKAKYKQLWKQAKAATSVTEDTVHYLKYEVDRLQTETDLQEQVLNFMTDYCLEQRRLHRFNHDHCVKHTVQHLDDKDVAHMSNAFTARLKEKLKDEPEKFKLIMDALNVEHLITG